MRLTLPDAAELGSDGGPNSRNIDVFPIFGRIARASGHWYDVSTAAITTSTDGTAVLDFEAIDVASGQPHVGRARVLSSSVPMIERSLRNKYDLLAAVLDEHLEILIALSEGRFAVVGRMEYRLATVPLARFLVKQARPYESAASMLRSILDGTWDRPLPT